MSIRLPSFAHLMKDFRKSNNSSSNNKKIPKRPTYQRTFKSGVQTLPRKFPFGMPAVYASPIRTIKKPIYPKIPKNMPKNCMLSLNGSILVPINACVVISGRHRNPPPILPYVCFKNYPEYARFMNINNTKKKININNNNNPKEKTTIYQRKDVIVIDD